MSIYLIAAGNLCTKLSVNNVQHRLFPFLRLRRNVFRCFSHNTDDPGLPVRYISKRQREVDKTQHITSVDISVKDGMPFISDSSVFRHKGLEGSKGVSSGSNEGKSLNAKVKLSNAMLDSRYETTDKEHIEVHEQVVNSMKVEAGDKEHIKVYERVVDCMKVPEVVAQESIYKRPGLSKGFKQNKDLSSDGVVDEEFIEEPEENPGEVSEEEDLNNLNVKGKLYRSKKDAEKLAVGLLGKRAFTAVELHKKLIAKHVPLNIVEAVLHDFQTRGLINDGLYAETFSHSRWKSSSWGPRRIKQALKMKGVTENDVQNAVKQVFEDSEEGDQRSSIKLSSSSLQQLYVQASKQWQRSQNVPYETRKARVIRWLQYRGFDWGVVGTIMKKLESQHP